MPDMLIKLYDLADDWNFIATQKSHGIIIRKPIGPEIHTVVDWMADNFSTSWAAETNVAISNRPSSCFIATNDSTIVGVSCYDATALGFFGPIGVAESCRGNGTGTSLLKACLLDMKLKGYGYAVVGGAGNIRYYEKTVGAIEIPDSTPGIYRYRIM
jgi:hypothetical protein